MMVRTLVLAAAALAVPLALGTAASAETVVVKKRISHGHHMYRGDRTVTKKVVRRGPYGTTVKKVIRRD